MTNFANWLTTQIEERGWTMTYLGKKIDMSHATVSQVASEKQKPSYEFCFNLAKAFQMRSHDVLVLAGLEKPGLPEVENEGELLDFYRMMTKENQEILLEIAKVLAARGK